MRWGCRVFVAVLVGLLGYSDCCAISYRHDVPQQDYFNLAANFPASGSVRAGGSLWCSGTLVAPNKVLTAAHQVRTLQMKKTQVRKQKIVVVQQELFWHCLQPVA